MKLSSLNISYPLRCSPISCWTNSLVSLPFNREEDRKVRSTILTIVHRGRNCLCYISYLLLVSSVKQSFQKMTAFLKRFKWNYIAS